jgi:mannosyltransferase
MLATGRLRAAPAWAAPSAPLPSARALGAVAAALAVAVAAAALRAHALAAPLWMDEGISLGIASHPLAAIPSLLREDGSPPLYYLTLHVWMAAFGSTPTAAHALSLTFFALAVPAAVWAAWTPFGPVAGALAGALVALDPFTAYYADDARMYTLVLLLGLLATGAFVRAFALRRRAHAGLFAVLLAALLYTHNWALFYAGATAAAYVALLAAGPGRRGLSRDGAIAFGGAALLFAPWLPTLAFQAAHTGAPWSTAPPGRALAAAPADILAGRLPETIVLLVAAGGALELVRRGGSARRSAALAVLAIAALTLLFGFAWSHLSSPAWATRYLVVVAAPLAIVAGAGLGRLRVLGIAALGVAVLVSWHGRPSNAALAHKSNVAQIASALGARLPAGSVVVTTQPEQVPALRYYLGARVGYVTPLGVVRDPRVMDWRDALARLDGARFGAVMTPVLRRLRAGARVLFVGPRFAAASSPWSREIIADTRRWRRALRRRLRVVATSAPARRSGMSTLAGMLLSAPRPRSHHGNGRPSRKNPPVGPSSGRSTAQSTLAAPSATERGAAGPPMSVRTHPGQVALTRIPVPRRSAARTRVIAFSAALATL